MNHSAQNNNSLPRRVRVKDVILSRYTPGKRPTSWDERAAGVECILTEDGETIALFSNGGQSSPAVGWELLLVQEQDIGDAERPKNIDPHATPFAWTLYGIARPS